MFLAGRAGGRARAVFGEKGSLYMGQHRLAWRSLDPGNPARIRTRQPVKYPEYIRRSDDSGSHAPRQAATAASQVFLCAEFINALIEDPNRGGCLQSAGDDRCPGSRASVGTQERRSGSKCRASTVVCRAAIWPRNRLSSRSSRLERRLRQDCPPYIGFSCRPSTTT